MQIVIYGLGRFFHKHEDHIRKLLQGDRVAAYVDKNAIEHSSLNGYEVLCPESIKQLQYDYILVTSVLYAEIKEELIELGVDQEKIVDIEQFTLIKNQGKVIAYGEQCNPMKKCVLIATPHLGRHGGAMTCLWAGMALMEQGYCVDLACGEAAESFIRVCKEYGIGVKLMQSFPRIGGKDIDWISKYDYVIANTVLMLPVAEIARRKVPTLWWIHENPDGFEVDAYREVNILYPRLQSTDWMKEVEICAVCQRAQIIFQKQYLGVSASNMAYGIPDCHQIQRKKNGKIIFLLVGYFCKRKAQDLFVDAAIRLSKGFPNRCEFWLAGMVGEGNLFSDELLQKIDNNKEIKILGEKSQKELAGIYEEIDISVCASRSECLQIVTVEGMMHKKVCISTDASGMTQYIENGQNGLVFESESSENLYEKMKWCVEHYDDETYNKIRIEARRCYEKHFSMDAFKERLQSELLLAKQKWEESHQNYETR